MKSDFFFDYSNLRASIGLSLAAFLAGRIPKIIPVQVVITKVVSTILWSISAESPLSDPSPANIVFTRYTTQ